MGRLTRLAAATFVTVGGLVHPELWRSGYRGIPSIGEVFVAHVVASALVAGAVLVRTDRRVLAAGVALAVGSLAAGFASRTVGLLGLTERVWTDDAVLATTASLGTIVAFAVAAAASRPPGAALVPVPVRVRVRGRHARR